MEPEYTALIGIQCDVHFSRLPVYRAVDLADRLVRYRDDVGPAIRQFGDLRSHPTFVGAVVACSGSFYPLGPTGDAEICYRISAESGVPVVSSSLATILYLKAHNISDVILVSPYEPWLTKLSHTYWTDAGITIRDVVTVPTDAGGFSPYDVAPDRLHEQLSSLPEGNTPILLTGTGMRTLDVCATLLGVEIPFGDAAAALAGAAGRAVITTNLAGAWWGTHRSAEVAS